MAFNKVQRISTKAKFNKYYNRNVFWDLTDRRQTLASCEWLPGQSIDAYRVFFNTIKFL